MLLYLTVNKKLKKVVFLFHKLSKAGHAVDLPDILYCVQELILIKHRKIAFMVQ